MTHVIISVDIIFVSTTLITLIIVHITSIFIFPHPSHVELNIHARLLCKNISESIMYVLSISYCWNIRAIYWQYWHLKFRNIVNRWLWYSTSNWSLKYLRRGVKYSYIAAQHYICRFTWHRCSKINIALICIIIKVINIVEKDIMSTETITCVKGTRLYKLDSLLSEQRCASSFWSFGTF